MSEIESSSPPVADAGALLGKLLSNPDLLRNISSAIGSSAAAGAGETTPAPTPESSSSAPQEGAVTDGISRVLNNPEMMAKLPDVMRMLAPMMQNSAPASEASVPVSAAVSNSGGVKDRRGCRNDLLLALKPFLSPERCRAIDMLLGLSRLGDALQKMV